MPRPIVRGAAPVAAIKALGEAKAQRALTEATWKEHERSFFEAPASEGPDARALLELWADPSVSMSRAVEESVAFALKRRGYPAELGRRPTGDVASSIAVATAGNVTEPDVDFEALVTKAGLLGATVDVAVLDLGFDLSHPAFSEKLDALEGETAGNGVDDDGNGRVDDTFGWDYVERDAELQPRTGSRSFHGSHVLGIATRGTERIKAFAARVGGPNVVEAIDDSVKRGARVVNLSLALLEYSPAVAEAIARHPAVLFVKAAGNSGYPGTDEGDLRSARYSPDTELGRHRLANLAVVANAASPTKLNATSSRGAPFVTHAALGTEHSAIAKDSFETQSGSSMAAPNLTAVAAKMLVLDPQLGPAQVLDVLHQTSTRHPAFEGLVAAGGVIDQHRATRVAALSGLMRRGATGATAAASLELSEADRALLLPLAQALVEG